MSSRGRFQAILFLSILSLLVGGVPVALADHEGICKELRRTETKCDDVIDPEKLKDKDGKEDPEKRKKADAAKAACERMKTKETEAADRRKKTCGKITADRQELDSCASLTTQSEYEKCTADAYSNLARDTGKLAEDDDASLKEIGDARKEMDASAEGIGKEDTLGALDKESDSTTGELDKMSTAAKSDSNGYGDNSLEAQQRANNLTSAPDTAPASGSLAGAASAPASPSVPAPVAAGPGGSAAPANNPSASPPSQSVQQASAATSPTGPALPSLPQSTPAGSTPVDAGAAQVFSSPVLAAAARSAPQVSPTSASVASAAVDQAGRALSSQAGSAAPPAANRLAPTAPASGSGSYSGTSSGGAGLDRMRTQIQRGLASSSASSETTALGSGAEETALAKAGIAPADARRNEATGGWDSGASSGSASTAAQTEALSPFGKPLGDPKISLMGSDTDKEIKRMLLESESGAAEDASLDVDADDGIGEKNGPSLFQRAHLMHETSVRKGRVRGIAIR